jgi:hypothetical protein
MIMLSKVVAGFGKKMDGNPGFVFLIIDLYSSTWPWCLLGFLWWKAVRFKFPAGALSNYFRFKTSLLISFLWKIGFYFGELHTQQVKLNFLDEFFRFSHRDPIHNAHQYFPKVQEFESIDQL